MYLPVARDRIPQATICLDPFHVMKRTNEVIDSVYRAEAPRLPPACDVDSLTAMIYLCLGGITITLPTERPS